MSEAGLPKVSCFLLSKDKSNEAELLRMITATESRNEINSYLYKISLVAKYLPHLNVFGHKRMSSVPGLTTTLFFALFAVVRYLLKTITARRFR